MQGQGPQFVELAARFAARLGGKLDEMIDACTAQRYPDLAELAHWLKGAGGTVGYDVFTKPARLLETAAKSRQEGPVLQAMRALLEIASRVPDVTVSRALPAEDAVAPATEGPGGSGAQLVEAAAEPIVSRLAGNARMQRFVDQFLDRVESELNIMRDAAQSADLATLAASARSTALLNGCSWRRRSASSRLRALRVSAVSRVSAAGSTVSAPDRQPALTARGDTPSQSSRFRTVCVSAPTSSMGDSILRILTISS